MKNIPTAAAPPAEDMAQEPDRVYLVICIPDQSYDVPQMVLRHESVAFKNDAVWFGKPGRAICPSHIRKLKAQIEEGFPTEVAILNPHSDKKIVYVASLLDVSSKLPKEPQLIPAFYEELNLLRYIKTWLKLEYGMEGYLLEELPSLEKAVAVYNRAESKYLKKGPVNMPGYFFLWLDEPE